MSLNNPSTKTPFEKEIDACLEICDRRTKERINNMKIDDLINPPTEQ